MIRKSATVVTLVIGFLLLGTNAFAEGIEACMADEVTSASLASTGAGLDVQTWLIGGIALLAVGATLAIVSPRRSRSAEAHSIQG